MWEVLGSLWLGFMPITIDSPQEITPEWEARVLGIKYGVTDLSHAVQEMTTGLIDEYFGKDFIERINTAIEKNPSGEFVEYWENGNIKAKFPYKDRKAHGHLHAWFDNGVDAFKGYFKEGIKQGTHITFYRIEPKYKVKLARLLRYNSMGHLTGKQTREHPNGRLYLVISYENGKANGPLKSWQDSGQEIMSADYKNGKLKKNPPPPPGKRGRPKEREDIKLVDELVANFENEIEKEFKIRAMGSGGSMPFDVESISVDFASMDSMNVEEARRLMVTLKERLAERINQNEKLRPYLRDYPLSTTWARIRLVFFSRNGDEYMDGGMCHVLDSPPGKISYIAKNPETKIRETVFEEPYEEALLIVKQQGFAGPRK